MSAVVFATEDAAGFVFGQREDPTGPQADREYWPADDGRNDPLESAAIYRQFGFENRMFVVQHSAAPGGDCAEGTGGLCRRNLTEPHEPFGDAFDPEGAVRIQKDVFGSIIAQESQNLNPIRVSIWFRAGFDARHG